MDREFYKQHPNDTIWCVLHQGVKGLHEFSFDKKKVFNLFRDYPHELTDEQVAIFDAENPYWAEYFSDRK